MTRTQKTLAGILVVQGILIFAASGPFNDPELSPEPRPLIPNLEEITPARLEVRGPEDRTVTLSRDDGDGWRIEEAGGYPAETDKVDHLIDTLASLEVRRPVVSNSRYHAALKVTEEDNERRLRVWDDPSGSPAVDLYMGTSPNYRTSHVRAEGEDRVYEVSGFGTTDLRDTAGGWITTKFVEADLTDVTRFRLKNSKGTLELEKKADGSWGVVAPTGSRGMELDVSAVDALVRAATGLQVADPAGLLDRAAQGLEPPEATATLQVKDEPAPPATEGEADDEAAAPETREITVWVGSLVPDKDTQRYVARSDFDFAAQVWKGSVDKLVETSLADLAPADD